MELRCGEVGAGEVSRRSGLGRTRLFLRAGAVGRRLVIDGSTEEPALRVNLKREWKGPPACTGVERMWTSRVGILGRPRGAGWGSQCGTGPAEGRLAQDLARRAKIRGQDARIGHRVWRTWVGQSEATAGSRASPRRGPERACGGAWARVGRQRAGAKLEKPPRGSRLGPVGAPWAAEPREAASGGLAVALDKGL